MTQMQMARKGNISPEMEIVSKDEGVDLSTIIEGIAKGTIIIPVNKMHKNIHPVGIGKGLRTKINVNIGTSEGYCNIEEEIMKVKVSAAAKADSIMDLSTGGDLRKIRAEILNASNMPIGTVPVYQSALETIKKDGSIGKMTKDDLFRVIEEQAIEGIDFITVHCGVTKESISRIKKEGRILDIVSRGGALILEWIKYNEKENPLYEDFDRLVEIAKRYDLTLSLGDGLRPGAIADATDRGQIQELLILGELTDYAWKEGVQVMIEGPGHVPINQIEANVRIEKEICKGAPFYVLGPLVTDIAPGYDHITASIGGAIAASTGADFLCCVTPSEHLRLPTVEDVKNGIIAFRIAAHAADIAKGVKGAIEWDEEFSKKRKKMDWEGQARLSIDPDLVVKMRNERKPEDKEVCTMCGSLCSIKGINECME